MDTELKETISISLCFSFKRHRDSQMFGFTITFSWWSGGGLKNER